MYPSYFARYRSAVDRPVGHGCQRQGGQVVVAIRRLEELERVAGF
jgi:hypothetical protein